MHSNGSQSFFFFFCICRKCCRFSFTFNECRRASRWFARYECEQYVQCATTCTQEICFRRNADGMSSRTSLCAFCRTAIGVCTEFIYRPDERDCSRILRFVSVALLRLTEMHVHVVPCCTFPVERFSIRVRNFEFKNVSTRTHLTRRFRFFGRPRPAFCWRCCCCCCFLSTHMHIAHISHAARIQINHKQ